MAIPTTPNEPKPTPKKHPNPSKPGQGQSVQPNDADTEINPGKTGNKTEVNLDKSKIKTFPDKNKPQRQ